MPQTVFMYASVPDGWSLARRVEIWTVTVLSSPA